MTYRVLSYGGGVQSTTMALMFAHGEIGPMPDVAIYTETADSQVVREYVSWMASGNVLPYPLVTAKRTDLTDDILAAASGASGRVSNPPFFTLDKAGKRGQLNRSCTRDYKINITQAKARQLYESKFGRIKPGCIELSIGISSDEATRFTTRSPKYISLRYPFLERATDFQNGSGLWFSRRDCIAWLTKHGYPIPAKSACVFCPYRSNENWRWLRDNDPDGWAGAVKVDAAIRAGLPGTTASGLFVHSDCVPLPLANIEAPDPEADMFNNECEGACGI